MSKSLCFIHAAAVGFFLACPAAAVAASLPDSQALQEGTVLHCASQNLLAHATPEGLWLTTPDSTSANPAGRFRIKALGVGRASSRARTPAPIGSMVTFSASGFVSVADSLVSYHRDGMVEEYSVSPAGVRQDFLLAAPPPGAQGEPVTLRLALTGATVTASSSAPDGGVTLTPDHTTRSLAYRRLFVTDAANRQLPAAMEPVSPTEIHLRVDDSAAVYPLRIDPTIGDADWESENEGVTGGALPYQGGISGLAADANGNVYARGRFAKIGNVTASCVAKWDGTAWSAMRSLSAGAYIQVSGNDVYTISGGSRPDPRDPSQTQYGETLTRWDGREWKQVITELYNQIYSMTINRDNGYIFFGGATLDSMSRRTKIMGWNGYTLFEMTEIPPDPTEWQQADAISASYSGFYVGGMFRNENYYYIAQLPPSQGGVPLRSLGNTPAGAPFRGTNGPVSEMVANGKDLYVAGAFTMAGAVPARGIAKWDGVSWSSLGGGVPEGSILDMAVHGNDLYVAGTFRTAGGVAVHNLAKWNGSHWSPLGSGTPGAGVTALTVSGTKLYVTGAFDTAGGKTAKGFARVNLAGTSGQTAMEALAAAMAAVGLTGTDALPDAIPFGDGVNNLMKFACGMDLAAADSSALTPGTGTSGLPAVSLRNGTAPGTKVLRLEYLRRTGIAVAYLPEISVSATGPWKAFSSPDPVSVATVNAGWERVVHEETVTTSTAFGRLRVSIP